MPLEADPLPRTSRLARTLSGTMSLAAAACVIMSAVRAGQWASQWHLASQRLSSIAETNEPELWRDLYRMLDDGNAHLLHGAIFLATGLLLLVAGRRLRRRTGR